MHLKQGQARFAERHAPIEILAGMPHTGGRLLAGARDAGYPVLFSANAFARAYPRDHRWAGYFKGFRLPDPRQFAGLDAALDSAGFVASARYWDYRWELKDYLDLVASNRWRWWSAMDYCCEPELAGNRPLRLLRIAATVHLYRRCFREAQKRGLPPPMPVLQGWTPQEYLTCVDWLCLREWPELVGVGSMCRRAVKGPNGVLAVLAALESVIPRGTRFHLFGVKSTALALIAHHSRIASVDSMAWDFQARIRRRTSRTVDFRLELLHAWLARQREIARRPDPAVGLQQGLFNEAPRECFSDRGDLVLEALALELAHLVLDDEIEFLDAYAFLKREGAAAMQVVEQRGLTARTRSQLERTLCGAGRRVRQLIAEGRLAPSVQVSRAQAA